MKSNIGDKQHFTVLYFTLEILKKVSFQPAREGILGMDYYVFIDFPWFADEKSR